MYINEYGEYCEARMITDAETGEQYKEVKSYQENGWTRINCFYADGTTTEEFERP